MAEFDGPLTYGALTRRVAHAVAAASAPGPASHPHPGQEAAGILYLFDSAHRHTRFLATHLGEDSLPARLADLVGQAVAAARQHLPDQDPTWSGQGSLWAQAADDLTLAHDLLASQLGPSGEARGRDAPHLADRRAVHGATARLADITLTAAISAAGTATTLLRHHHTRREPGPPAPSVQALHSLGGIIIDLSHLEHRGDGRGGGVLDDVGPLLGDRRAHPLDRGLEHLRLVSHRLSQPGSVCHHRILLAFADSAAMIAGRAEQLQHLTAGLADPAARDRFQTAAVHSGSARRSWQTLSAALRAHASLGTDSTAARRLAADTARRLDTVTRQAAHGDLRTLHPALRAARRSVLILPDLADTGVVTLSRMYAANALIGLIPEAAPLGPQGARELRALYADAQKTSHQAVAAAHVLPGVQPLPARAAYLAGRTPAQVTANPLQARLDRTHPLRSAAGDGSRRSWAAAFPPPSTLSRSPTTVQPSTPGTVPTQPRRPTR